MNKLTREEFVEALKVPIIMGRGRAYGVVIGDHRFHGLLSWARENDPSIVEVLDAGNKKPFGMHMLITLEHPDTFFAVTESEYADMCKRLGVVDTPNDQDQL